MKKFSMLGLIITTIVAMNCGGKKVMVPPRIDLSDYEMIGIIEFTCNQKGKLGDLATRRFMEAAREDQSIVRIVQLGTEKEVLSKIGERKLEQSSYKEIGETYGVATIFIGRINISDVRPDIKISPGLFVMDFSAEVDATLDVQMVEAETGATLWNRSSETTERIGGVSILGLKDFAFDAKDPDKAYGKLVNRLVWDVTYDFRVRWVRQ